MRVSTNSYIAEFLGTFFFVLSIFVSQGNPFMIGAALALVIFMIAGVSGGMVNPAVSFAMMMSGKIDMAEFISFALAQLAGGAGAFYAFKMLRR
jgi:glycerol uptake facilitator-like aquaporin